MDMVVCPHCKTHRFVTTRVPKDVVVVMPCPSCHELAVLFRSTVIPLSRKILESGSMDERRTHLADVIAQFLDAGLFPLSGAFTPEEMEEGVEPERKATKAPAVSEEPDGIESPISNEEVEKFVKIGLKCIDNAAYFRRHFG